jgi:hypothetical protein
VNASNEGEALIAASRPTEPADRVAWGLRLNGSVGYASFPNYAGGGPAGRVGVDGEYWLSRNVGVGLELGLESLGTLNWCGGTTCTDAKATRVSLAPAIAVRGNNLTSFPIASLALGYAVGHSQTTTIADLGYIASSGWASDAAVPYASLIGAWLFHLGHVRPASAAFALGPLVRLDGFPFAESVSGALSSGSFAWAFTLGVTLGLGVETTSGKGRATASR